MDKEAICLLHKSFEQVQLPSILSGVVYEPYDENNLISRLAFLLKEKANVLLRLSYGRIFVLMLKMLHKIDAKVLKHARAKLSELRFSQDFYDYPDLFRPNFSIFKSLVWSIRKLIWD